MVNPFKSEILVTSDGSHTLKLVGTNEQYHSRYGAITESSHIFIGSGLKYYLLKNKPGRMNILEIGLGTGLNALLTVKNLISHKAIVYYHALEPYPLDKNVLDSLNYCSFFLPQWGINIFEDIHSKCCNNYHQITSNCLFRTSVLRVQDAQLEKTFYNVVYFDAFSPEIQPELWSQEIFEKLINCLVADGILITYCTKGIVRRAMKAAGFAIEKISGPPGKKEITRAVKI